MKIIVFTGKIRCVLEECNPWPRKYLLQTGFLVGLLENPVLVEHEGFSEALLAVFHLQDELRSRDSFDDLPDTDRLHLAGDMNRAYRQLVEQWMIYLEHLKIQYPQIFSLAVRKNPFDPNASPVVLE